MAQRNASIRGEQIKDVFFGAGLVRSSGDDNIMDINFDNSSIEVDTDVLQVKALGITNDMLAGAITDGKLTEDYIKTSEVDNDTIEFTGSTLNVKANSIGAAEINEGDTYTFTSQFRVTTAPTVGNDVTNKTYVDGLVNGLDWKNSVRLATDTALAANTSAGSKVGKTLTADANGALTVDGVVVATSDRILVKNESTTSDNGIYTVTDTGDGSNPYILTRATDADNDVEVTAGLAVFIEEGTINDNRGYTLITNDPITVDTTGQVYTQFTGLGAVTAGDGLSKTGDTIDLDLNSLSAAVVDVSADSIAIVDASASNGNRKESIADLMTAVTAGNTGLDATSGVLALDFNELNTVGIDVASDLIAIVDATNASSKKASFSAIMTATAGIGIAASGGVLSIDLDEVSTVAIDVANDAIAFMDNSDTDDTKKTTWALFATAIAGTGITATNGVLSTDTVSDVITESDFQKSVQTATGAQTVMTTFSGSAAVVANSVKVHLNGLLQEDGGSEDYTIVLSTGVVTFVVGLDAGDVVTLSGVLDN